MPSSQSISIERMWNGLPALAGERVWLDVSVAGGALCVHVDAPRHGDPAPALLPGSCEGLWNYEVVELFLLGAGDRYLELEIGPHGHWLALELHGRRRRARSRVPVQVRCEARGARWWARIAVACSELPAELYAWNAYAIHGCGTKRRYLAMHAVPGARPDFHRLECFAPLPPGLLADLDAARRG